MACLVVGLVMGRRSEIEAIYHYEFTWFTWSISVLFVASVGVYEPWMLHGDRHMTRYISWSLRFDLLRLITCTFLSPQLTHSSCSTKHWSNFLISSPTPATHYKSRVSTPMYQSQKVRHSLHNPASPSSPPHTKSWVSLSTIHGLRWQQSCHDVCIVTYRSKLLCQGNESRWGNEAKNIFLSKFRFPAWTYTSPFKRRQQTYQQNQYDKSTINMREKRQGWRSRPESWGIRNLLNSCTTTSLDEYSAFTNTRGWRCFQYNRKTTCSRRENINISTDIYLLDRHTSLTTRAQNPRNPLPKHHHPVSIKPFDP